MGTLSPFSSLYPSRKGRGSHCQVIKDMAIIKVSHTHTLPLVQKIERSVYSLVGQGSLLTQLAVK